MSPKQTEFKRRRHKDKLSSIFTATDDAFSLLFLDIDYFSLNNSGSGKKTRKQFTPDSTIGNKEGWSYEGRMLFGKLVEEVKKRREEEASAEIEQELRAAYRRENGDDRDDRLNKKRKLREMEKNFDQKKYWEDNDDLNELKSKIRAV